MCAFYIMWRRPIERRKVFFIGFNKCGTKSLHDLFAGAGYRSAHGRIKTVTGRKHNLALGMARNLAARLPVLTGMDGPDVFSDLMSLSHDRVIEGNRFYKEIYAHYPDAYFILNTRPVDRWVASRCNHDNAEIGSFLERYGAATGLGREAVIASWRTLFAAHHAEARDFFAAQGRFLEFDISDDIRGLIDFVRADYALDAARWRQLGRSADRKA